MRKLCTTLFIFFALMATASPQTWFTDRGGYLRTGSAEGESPYVPTDTVLLWSFHAGEPIRSSPVTADLDGDGTLEIIFGSDTDRVYALTYRGRLLWNYTAGGNVRGTPTVDDVDGDGKPEVLFGSDDRRLHVLDSDGNLKWSYETGGFVRSSPVVANLGGTTDKEVVFGSYDGRIYCLTHRGAKMWDYKTQEAIDSSPALFDINNDGEKEIIVGSDDNIVYVLKHPPHKVWTYQTSGDVSTPAIDSGGKIIASSGDKRVYKLGIESKGTALTRRVLTETGWTTESIALTGLSHTWNYTTGGGVEAAAAVGYVNGTYGVVAASRDRVLYFIDSRLGSVMDSYTLNKPVESSPAIADFDGDNMTEAVFGSDDGVVYVITYPGVRAYSFETGGAVKSSPAITDLTGDGRLEFIVGSDDGFLYVFGDRRGGAITGGDVFYGNAVRYYGIGDIESSKINLERARRLYMEADYDEGVVEVDNLLNVMEADAISNEAQSLMQEDELLEAKEKLEEASEIYRTAGHQEGVDECERMYKLIEAETYYREAQYYYERELYFNASLYAEAAKRFYISAGDVEGLRKASELSNVTQAHGKADTYLDDALAARDEGRFDVAAMYLGFAKQAYEIVGNTEGYRRADELLQTMEADKTYGIAYEHYNNSEFDEARDYAERALELYGDSTGGFSREARELYNKTAGIVEAEGYYEDADRYYAATDFRSAAEYARLARDTYNSSGYYGGYVKAGELLARAEEAYITLHGGGGMSGLLSPTTLLIALTLAAAAFILLRKRKTPKWIMGGPSYPGRSAATYRMTPPGESISLIQPIRVEEKLARRGMKKPGKVKVVRRRKPKVVLNVTAVRNMLLTLMGKTPPALEEKPKPVKKPVKKREKPVKQLPVNPHTPLPRRKPEPEPEEKVEEEPAEEVGEKEPPVEPGEWGVRKKVRLNVKEGKD